MKNAHKLVDKSKELQDNMGKIKQEILNLKKEKVETIVSLIYILDSLDRTRGYAEDIAETAINHCFVV